MTEGKEYFKSFENIGDLIAYILVIICQCFYWGTGEFVNGYFFPDDGSFEDYLFEHRKSAHAYIRTDLNHNQHLYDTEIEAGSRFESFLLITVLLLHFNLVM